MKAKTMIKMSICGILSIIIIIGALIYRVDPYLYYHKPDNGLSYVMEMNDFAYYNPGIAKNFNYDTAITGSSMTRAFLPSYVDEKLGCKTVKLSMPSARGKDLSRIFTLLEDNSNLKTVILGLDGFAFNVDKDYEETDKPEFLYDNNSINDIQYLYNINSLIQSSKTFSNTLKNLETTSQDDYQNYALDGEFNREKVIGYYLDSLPIKKVDDINPLEIENGVKENLNQNLIPYIERMSSVRFIIFFPPYSILRWGLQPNLKNEIYTNYYLIKNLIEYPNVEIYFPQGDIEIITDLDHYMDTMHYDEYVTKYIVDTFSNSNSRLKNEDVEVLLSNFYFDIKNHDFTVYK